MGAPKVSEHAALQTLDPDVEIDKGVDETGDQGTIGHRIRCPKCDWSPRAEDKWMCNCRHMWNTFDTGGICPSCMYQWKITQCLACRQVSRHSDWYA